MMGQLGRSHGCSTLLILANSSKYWKEMMPNFEDFHLHKLAAENTFCHRDVMCQHITDDMRDVTILFCPIMFSHKSSCGLDRLLS